jgi:hypothetical protein
MARTLGHSGPQDGGTKVGYFDGITGSLVRTSLDGRRFYVPLGKYGQIREIPDEAAWTRVVRRFKAFYYVLLGGGLAAVLFTQVDWRLLVLAPLAGLLAVPFASWAGRDLPPATIHYSDLPPVTRAQALEAYGRATGRRTLGIVLGISVTMTLVGLLTSLLGGGLALWLSTGLFAVCSVSTYLVFRRTS